MLRPDRQNGPRRTRHLHGSNHEDELSHHNGDSSAEPIAPHYDAECSQCAANLIDRDLGVGAGSARCKSGTITTKLGLRREALYSKIRRTHRKTLQRGVAIGNRRESAFERRTGEDAPKHTLVVTKQHVSAMRSAEAVLNRYGNNGTRLQYNTVLCRS